MCMPVSKSITQFGITIISTTKSEMEIENWIKTAVKLWGIICILSMSLILYVAFLKVGFVKLLSPCLKHLYLATAILCGSDYFDIFISGSFVNLFYPLCISQVTEEVMICYNIFNISFVDYPYHIWSR